MKQDKELYCRIKGILIGGAVGDAYGMPTEFWTYNQIRKEFPDGVPAFLPSLKNDFIRRELPAGSVTDDTINTVMLLESIVTSQGFLNAQDYIEHLVDWVSNSEDAKLVTGPSTLRAVNAIKQGVPIERTGLGSTTNGSAMKIAPVGIVSDYRDLDTLIKNVYSVCLPTHNTDIAVSGASVIAACISYVSSGKKDISELWDLAMKAAEQSKNIGHEFPGPSLSKRLEYVRSIADRCTKQEAVTKVIEELGTGVETIETIPAVLMIAQLAKGDPMEAARISAGLGGDTDTIGAIAAGICGGMNPKFDDQIITLIETVNHLNFDKLAQEILPFSPYNKNGMI